MRSDEYSRIENGKVVGAAIDFMRMQPKNADGTMGYEPKQRSPEWQAWHDYFEANGMKGKAHLMRVLQTYRVPCADPRDFDPDYRPAIRERAPHVGELTQADRDRLAGRLQGMFRPAPKYQPKPEASPLARRELSDAEKASAERLTAAVQKQRQEAAE